MNLDNYVEVAERITQFFNKYPEGSLTAADPLTPIRIINIEGINETHTFLEYVCIAKRHPNDHGGVGIAWEPFPGKTTFTRDSEAMVAETSARGRAIIAVMDLENNKASRDEVLARTTRYTPTIPAADDPWATDTTPRCAHGLMKLWEPKDGKGKAAYYCPLPKDAPGKCERVMA
jgi:hypothetical protein